MKTKEEILIALKDAEQVFRKPPSKKLCSFLSDKHDFCKELIGVNKKLKGDMKMAIDLTLPISILVVIFNIDAIMITFIMLPLIWLSKNPPVWAINSFAIMVWGIGISTLILSLISSITGLGILITIFIGSGIVTLPILGIIGAIVKGSTGEWITILYGVILIIAGMYTISSKEKS